MTALRQGPAALVEGALMARYLQQEGARSLRAEVGAPVASTRTPMRAPGDLALLPWPALGFSPRVGDRYRFNIIMPDHDEATPYAPGWGQLIWASAPTNTTTAEKYCTSTTNTATITISFYR